MKPLTDVQTEFFASAARMIVPEAVLVGAACALFLLAVFLPRRSLALGIGMLGVAGAALAAVVAGPQELDTFRSLQAQIDYPAEALAPFLPTGPAAFVRWLAIVSAGLFLLVCWPELRDDTASEYVGCLLVVAAGTSLVGRANDLISLFLSLEMVSIPTYVLLYLPVRTRATQEAAVKYFLLSVLSSGVLLFGFSYLYGAAGTTNLSAVAGVLAAQDGPASPLAVFGAVMVVAGLGFRIAAVPFQFYAPDVYEAGPTGVVAQLAFVPKVVGFVALGRVLGLFAGHPNGVPFTADNSVVPLALWLVAGMTMCFGNSLALLQDNLKRLFAYSGIAHSGYMLLGLLVASSLPAGTNAGQSGADAVLVYLAAYGLMTVGAFAVLMAVGGAGKPLDTVDDLAGLGQSHPAAALSLAVCLLSLIGLPLTAGFVGKFLLFAAAFEVPSSGPMGGLLRLLVAVAAVNAAAGAVYYLRALGAMYLRPPANATEPQGTAGLLPLTAAVVCAVGTLVFGVYPDPLATAARVAAPVPATSAPAGVPQP